MEPLVEELLTWKLAVVGLWFVAFFLAERLLPAAPMPAELAAPDARRRRLGRNLAFWAINAGLSLLFVVPLTGWAAVHPLWERPGWWSGLPGLALDLLLLDLGIYWWHRFNHEWKLLWRFHAVHHLDRTLDASSALRFHVGEVALSASVRAAAMIALAMPVASVLLFETLLLLATIFHHSNLKLPRRFERAISRAVITPEIHWVHHHALRRDTDSNYGSFVTLWDILFGTRNRRPRDIGMEIGVEGRSEGTLPALIVLPFRRQG
jgi:sterol desaturase/sphingolipid hydroxylase (fatty acid hydroxylase superfamily)